MASPAGIPIESIAEIHCRHAASLHRLQLLGEVARLGLGYAQVVRDIEGLQGLPKNNPLLDQLETYARQQSPDFFDFHALVTVRLWSILEVFVHDMCCFLLEKVPSVRQLPGVSKLKGPITEFLNADSQEQADYLYELLESSCSAALKPGAGRFEAVLSLLGYGGPVNKQVRDALFHCSKLRNCIAHNDGIVDRQLVKACPWWKGTEGTRVGITAAMSQKHFYATCWYMMEVQRRILPPDFERMDKLVEEQESYIDCIEKGGTPGRFPFA